jgi:hypothetical protein
MLIRPWQKKITLAVVVTVIQSAQRRENAPAENTRSPPEGGK